MTSRDADNDLVLEGVVRYTLDRDCSGKPIIDAKWVSTRIVSSGQTGTGRAVCRPSGVGINKVETGFEGDWTIEYFGPDGQLAVTAFVLNLIKKDQIYHGQWRLPNGDLVLEGFGFEEDGKLMMRYGNLR